MILVFIFVPKSQFGIFFKKSQLGL